METIRISILGEYEIYLEGLRALLDGVHGICVCNVLSDFETKVHSICEAQPHVVLIDVHSPLQHTLDAIGHILTDCPRVKVLALMANQGGDGLARIIRAGANGYVLKSTSSTELIAAIRKVAGGGAVIDPAIAVQVLSDYRRLIGETNGSEERCFSPRELRILRMLADGASNKDVAQELILSQQTIKNILSEIYRKLHAENRTEAVTLALRAGLISASD